MFKWKLFKNFKVEGLVQIDVNNSIAILNAKAQKT